MFPLFGWRKCLLNTTEFPRICATLWWYRSICLTNRRKEEVVSVSTTIRNWSLAACIVGKLFTRWNWSMVLDWYSEPRWHALFSTRLDPSSGDCARPSLTSHNIERVPKDCLCRSIWRIGQTSSKKCHRIRHYLSSRFAAAHLESFWWNIFRIWFDSKYWATKNERYFNQHVQVFGTSSWYWCCCGQSGHKVSTWCSAAGNYIQIYSLDICIHLHSGNAKCTVLSFLWQHVASRFLLFHLCCFPLY